MRPAHIDTGYLDACQVGAPATAQGDAAARAETSRLGILRGLRIGGANLTEVR